MESSCLRCHTAPVNAPQEMVRLYGPERSFNRKLGDVVSAISLRIPLSKAYSEANRFSLELSALLLAVLVAACMEPYLLTRRLLLSPLIQIRNQAVRIGSSDEYLGEMIPEPRAKELREVVSAFNDMSASLKRSYDDLENRVVQRTSELEHTNRELEKQILERKRAEEAKARLVADLSEALAEVETLSGFLPICASCKKIRDDQGYWQQVEEFIREHSEAEFSHGICPDCAKKLYPDFCEDEPDK